MKTIGWVGILMLLVGCRSFKNDPGSGSRIPTEREKKIPAFVHKFSQYFDSSFKKLQAPGAAVVIIKGDSLLWMQVYGVKTEGDNDSVDFNTVFRVGSVSKTFAGTLTQILVDSGYFNWDDKVIRYVPDFKLKDPKATQMLSVSDLLSHTTGLPKHAYTNMIEESKSYNQLKQDLANVDLAGSPGAIYSYQNVAFSVIGEIIEKTTGLSYPAALDKLIFQPLQMSHASSTYDAMKSETNAARAHVFSEGKYVPVTITPEYYAFAPAAGVNASISDMAKYLKMLTLAEPSVISAKSLQQLYKPLVKTRNYLYGWPGLKQMYYAHGWRVINFRNDTIIYHSGFVKGFRSDIAVYPKDRLGIAVLFNFNSTLANDCIPTFFDQYFGITRVNISNPKKKTIVLPDSCDVKTDSVHQDSLVE